jgi:hypothetical protein
MGWKHTITPDRKAYNFNTDDAMILSNNEDPLLIFSLTVVDAVKFERSETKTVVKLKSQEYRYDEIKVYHSETNELLRCEEKPSQWYKIYPNAILRPIIKQIWKSMFHLKELQTLVQ